MIRLAALSFLLLASLDAATFDELVREGTAAEARLDPAGALEFFQQADAEKPNTAFILQKIARQYSDQVPDQKTDAARKEFATRALEYAQRSVDLEPNNAVYVLSLAICHGHLALVSDVRNKVQYSRLIKDESERALQLDPNYAWAHHMLGRWHYEVAEFGPVQRFFAKIFYGGLPVASAAEAVNHLQRATELEPGEVNHWVDLGFAYAAAGRKTEARVTWEKSLAMPNRGKHDPAAKRRAKEALAALD